MFSANASVITKLALYNNNAINSVTSNATSLLETVLTTGSNPLNINSSGTGNVNIGNSETGSVNITSNSSSAINLSGSIIFNNPLVLHTIPSNITSVSGSNYNVNMNDILGGIIRFYNVGGITVTFNPATEDISDNNWAAILENKGITLSNGTTFSFMISTYGTSYLTGIIGSSVTITGGINTNDPIAYSAGSTVSGGASRMFYLRWNGAGWFLY